MKVVGKIRINRLIGRLCRQKRKHKAKSYYNSINDLHKGKRGFIVGNGPSLAIEDLNKLKKK